MARIKSVEASIRDTEEPEHRLRRNLSALACLWLMLNLPTETWIRFAVWTALGLVLYFAYGHRHSRLAAGRAERPARAAVHPGR